MTVPFIRATGEPFELGYRHGLARAAALRAFLDDGLARMSKLAPAPVSLSALGPVLAEGAGISRQETVLLQVRREVIGYQRVPVPSRGDCTTYASLSDGPGGEPVLAQTVDLNGDLDDQIAVLDVGLSGSGRRALLLSFGGLLGYLGVNSDGLAIGLNLVLGGEWGPGLPPYLAIRHLLDNAGCVADAVGILRDLPLASSRALMLCDPASAVCVELLDGTVRLLDPTELVHTNHFLHPDFARHDQLNVFARNSSLLRRKAAATALAAFAQAGTGAGVEEHFELLSQPPICVAGDGDIRRERTVAAVVLVPGRANCTCGRAIPRSAQPIPSGWAMGRRRRSMGRQPREHGRELVRQPDGSRGLVRRSSGSFTQIKPVIPNGRVVPA